jgi:E3 ubiquitin-protein ligase RGLG
MGSSSSKPKKSRGFQVIPDHYKSYEDVTEALRTAGLESSSLMIGIDMSRSNLWTGKRTYGRPLHEVDPRDGLTAYSRVISCIGGALEELDDDKVIPMFRFGDAATTDKTVAGFDPSRPADPNFQGMREVLAAYHALVPSLVMSGPTTLAPAIEAAMQVVKASGQFHVLLLLTDGDVSDPKRDADAIVRASQYPLSIIIVGLGDGPFDTLRTFDDGLPKRVFDNCQSVILSEIEAQFATTERPDLLLALHVLMELPEQYKEIRARGMLTQEYIARLP